MKIDLNGLTRSELRKVIRFYNLNNDIVNTKDKTLKHLREEIHNHLEFVNNKINVKQRQTEWDLNDMKKFKKILKVKLVELEDKELEVLSSLENLKDAKNQVKVLNNEINNINNAMNSNIEPGTNLKVAMGAGNLKKGRVSKSISTYYRK